MWEGICNYTVIVCKSMTHVISSDLLCGSLESKVRSTSQCPNNTHSYKLLCATKIVIHHLFYLNLVAASYYIKATHHVRQRISDLFFYGAEAELKPSILIYWDCWQSTYLGQYIPEFHPLKNMWAKMSQ